MTFRRDNLAPTRWSTHIFPPFPPTWCSWKLGTRHKNSKRWWEARLAMYLQTLGNNKTVNFEGFFSLLYILGWELKKMVNGDHQPKKRPCPFAKGLGKDSLGRYLFSNKFPASVKHSTGKTQPLTPSSPQYWWGPKHPLQPATRSLQISVVWFPS